MRWTWFDSRGFTDANHVSAAVGASRRAMRRALSFVRPPEPFPLLTLDNTNASRYYKRVIRSFADPETERLFRRDRPRRIPGDIHRTAPRKLLQIDAATFLSDLRVPPGNRLEALKGDHQGQHSIRINDQWRICFTWEAGHAHDVEIVDYR
jgi:proteic killer suppression protein